MGPMGQQQNLGNFWSTFVDLWKNFKNSEFDSAHPITLHFWYWERQNTVISIFRSSDVANFVRYKYCSYNMSMVERDCVSLNSFYTAFEHDIGTVPTDRLTLCFPDTMCHILDTFSSLSHARSSAHIPCVISHIAIHIMYMRQKVKFI